MRIATESIGDYYYWLFCVTMPLVPLQVENELARGVEGNLKRVAEDLMRMRSENAQLMSRVAPSVQLRDSSRLVSEHASVRQSASSNAPTPVAAIAPASASASASASARASHLSTTGDVTDATPKAPPVSRGGTQPPPPTMPADPLSASIWDDEDPWFYMILLYFC